MEPLHPRQNRTTVANAASKVDAGERVGFGMVISLAMLSFLAVFREGPKP